MSVNSVNKAEGIRVDQMRSEKRQADEARAEAQKRADQNSREVSETRTTTEDGRGKAMDVTA